MHLVLSVMLNDSTRVMRTTLACHPFFCTRNALKTFKARLSMKKHESKSKFVNAFLLKGTRMHQEALCGPKCHRLSQHHAWKQPIPALAPLVKPLV
jgi:hypothetical protein